MKLALRIAAILACSIASTPSAATAQLVSVVVGVNPSCPYGLAA